MNLKRLFLIALLTSAAVGCADKTTEPPNPPGPPPPPPPQPPPPPPPAPPGSGIVALVTPNGDDGAVVVTLRGPGMSDLATASSGYLFYSRLASDTVARLIVLGNITAGPIFTFKPASGTALSAYTASIDQIATRADAMRSTLSSYSLSITPAP